MCLIESELVNITIKLISIESGLISMIVLSMNWTYVIATLKYPKMMC